MAKIKTRDAVKGTIKIIDKAAVAGQRVKNTAAKTKETAEDSYHNEQHSATEYATDKVSGGLQRITQKGVRKFNEQGQKSVQTTKENVIRIKDKVADIKEKRAVNAAEKKKAEQAAVGRAGKRSPGPGQPGRASHNSIRTEAASRAPRRVAPQESANVNRTSGQSVGKIVQTPAQGTKKQVKSVAKGLVKTVSKKTLKTTRRGIKTAKGTSRVAIKTTEQTARAAQHAAKVSLTTTQKAAQAARVAGKAAITVLKASTKATISAIKAIIVSTKALITALIAGGWVAALLILIVVLFGAMFSLLGGSSENSSYTPVSAEVQAYDQLIQKYAREHGIPEYVELIKAVMMQESGGRGTDPMQASECGYNTRYPNKPNAITDPEYSVNVGIQNLADCLKQAEVISPIDMDHIKLALQGYNYGNGYISWAVNNYGEYSYVNAVEFSNMMAARLGWAKYGDTQYVAHVLRYYPFGRIPGGIGNQAIVEVAATQLGNVGGQPYWSWYGFGGRVEWCACFVSWCADQCGYIESGVIPKFSLCTDGVTWFESRGQWQDRHYTPAPGDIIFFDWARDGLDGKADHVGIVEKAEGGIVYTVEGNSGDACRQRSYNIGYYEILGYGVPAY